jgi:hypothetical protein
MNEISNVRKNEELTAQDLSDRLWEELAFRQSHYWASFNRFSLSIILINISPYIRPEIAEPLGKMIFAFPIVALLLSLVCTWYLGSEYHRQSMVRDAYNKIIRYDELVPRMPTDGLWNRIMASRMGHKTSMIFGIGFTVISIVNILVLLYFPINALNGH